MDISSIINDSKYNRRFRININVAFLAKNLTNMNYKEFILTLDPNTTYLCPTDIFGHSSEYLSAIEVKYRLKRIVKYWDGERKECDIVVFKYQKRNVWNRELKKHEERNVGIIEMAIKDFKFVPFGALD